MKKSLLAACIGAMCMSGVAVASEPINVAIIDEPPFFTLSKDGSISGDMVDMVNSLLISAGYEPNYRMLPYDVALTAMQMNQYDLAFAMIPYNLQSCSNFLLGEPLVDYEMIAYKRSDDSREYSVVDTITDQIRTVTMANGQIAKGISEAVLSKDNLKLVDDSVDVLNWVLSDKADVGLTGLLTAKSYVDRGMPIEVIADFYDETVFAFDHVQATYIGNKNYPEVMEKFNAALAEYKKTDEWKSKMESTGFSSESVQNLLNKTASSICGSL